MGWNREKRKQEKGNGCNIRRKNRIRDLFIFKLVNGLREQTNN
jgi:hypothetical protein